VRAAGWFIAIGGAMVATGFLAGANLLLASFAVVYVVAVASFAGGLLMLLHASRERKLRWILVWGMSGFLYVAAAVAVLFNPLFVMKMLTFWLVFLFGSGGGVRLAIALSSRDDNRPWRAASGFASVALAFGIAVGWPGGATWVLGLLVSADLMLQGTGLTMVGLSIRDRG
jgi:uncharacterized membrane protein HdeD (DUF308 family)